MKFYESSKFTKTDECREAISEDESISVIWQKGCPDTAQMFDINGNEGQLEGIEWADNIAIQIENKNLN